MQDIESVHNHPKRPTWKWIMGVEITFFILFGGGIIGYILAQYTAWVPSAYHREIALQPSQTSYIKLSPSPIIPTTEPSPIPQVLEKTFYPVPTTNPLLTSNWKTYKNVEYAFSFRYPSTLKIKDIPCHTIFENCPTSVISLERLDTRVLPSGLIGIDDLNFMLGINDIDHLQNSWDYGQFYFVNKKDEGIILGGKTGRIFSAGLTPMASNSKDNVGIPVRDIDLPLKGKVHLRLHFQQDVISLDEFNQILSTFKFTD